jgi:PAS domain S-box-containing protein
MPQSERDSSVVNVPVRVAGVPGILRRSLAKLLSSAHLVLSGTTASILIIIFLGSLFVFVALRNHHRDEIRARTLQLTRLSSLIENDVAELENYYRGFLLTHRSQYFAAFQERRNAMKKRLEDLNSRLLDNPVQRKRVIKAQDIVLRWADQVAQPAFLGQSAPSTASATSSALTLSNASLDQARWILQSLKDEEQILLSQRAGEQEMATQSTQILDSLPKLERAVIEMNKEKRGFLLTNDNGFLETYRRSVENFYRYHAYLTILAGDAPRRTQLLSDIRSNLERWISSSAQPEIDAKQQGRDISAMIGSDQSEQLINQIQLTIAEFQKNELASYDAGSSAAVRHRIWSTIGLLTLVLVVALLISSNTYSLALVRRNLSKLGAAEIRIRAIIENILDGMIIVDRAGTITLMNPAAERLFGCSKDEMLNQAFLTLVPQAYNTEADLRLVDWEEFRKRTGTTVLAVGRTRRHVTFPIEISLAKLTVDQSTLYVAMIRDVTERKRFEREIAAEKENLAVTLRSIGDGVITTDLQGKIVMINQAAEALTGWTAEEAKGHPLKSVFKISIDLAAQTRGQRGTYPNEAYSLLLKLPSNATLVSRDGTEHLIEQIVSPIRDRRNEVAGVVLVFRDIIEREHKQLGLLAGGIAHDFNNLLTAIMGNISLASLLIPATDEMTTRLADAKNASMRARDLAQQLLTFARGGAPIKKTASLTRLVQDTVSFCLRGSQSRSECDLEDNLWPSEIDSGQISQVIANLVVNAEQAMPTGGTLHVTCGNFRHGSGKNATVPDLPSGEFVKITIRDEGVGIPEQNLKRIFDPYFTTKPKGNGLGLATAYSIVKHHKGLITVESEANKGSAFTIYLPAAAHIAVPEETRFAGAKELSGTGRVLIVDDEEAIRTLVEFTLTHLGYEVCSAASALEGIELYRQRLQAGQRFDCVILDLTLPGGMGGRDALRLLLEIDPSVNAIVSSGYAMDATMSHYQDFGFRGVITKPYEAAELGHTVREVIESGRIKVVPDLDLRAVG